jgi:hypothetical protein
MALPPFSSGSAENDQAGSYLEAEAAGVRPPGSAVSSTTKRTRCLESTFLASLYHFTIGGAIDDSRLSAAAV